MVMPKRVTMLDDVFDRPATPRALDFTNVRDTYYVRDEHGKMWVVNRAGIPFDHGITTEQTTHSERFKGSPGTGMAATSKQARARARRRLKRGARLTHEAFDKLYKPIDEWDDEELARGRPRNAAGDFRGKSPEFVTRELHERALERFKILIRNDMNAQSFTALRTIQMVLESNEVDGRGRPIVSAASKMDAAKFLLEHVVGKPTQPTTSDISIKLQGILGTVMVNPAELGGDYTPAHVGQRELPGAVDEDEDEDYGEG